MVVRMPRMIGEVAVMHEDTACISAADPRPGWERNEAEIRFIAKPYLWWEPREGVPHRVERAVAQIMNLGTYDDIRKLEALVPPAELVDIMRMAQPGWLSPRSWSFWRGRLGVDTSVAGVAEEPPRRTLGA